MLFAGGPNTRTTNPKWRTAAILDKSKTRHISATVWPNAMKFGSLTQFDHLDPSDRQTSWILKIQHGGGRYFEKLENRHISAAAWHSRHEILHGDGVWPCWPFRPLKSRNPIWPRPPFLKNRKIAISQQRFDRLLWNLVRIYPLACALTDKMLKFKKSIMEAVAILTKIEKSPVWLSVIILHFLFCLIKPQIL